MNRVFLTNNTPVKFDFEQRVDTFKVDEVLKYKLLKRGAFRLLKVKKVGKSTIELIEYLSEVLRVSQKEFGYAGLKDKHATTTQYITVPKDISIARFQNSDEVELVELGFVAERLKIGSLLGNKFEIVLENVDKNSYALIENAMNRFAKFGFANFFGHQRFGALEDAVEKGEKIADIGKRAKSQKAKIMLAAYQAKYFNEWLNRRLEISKKLSKGKKVEELKISPTLINTIANTPTLFKLLPGDLGFSYRSGRKNYELVNDIKKYSELFNTKKYYPTGVLFGSDVRLSNSIAGKIEREYIDNDFSALRGARRAAWVWAKDVKSEYNVKNKRVKLQFFLGSGSYATVLLEELANSKM